MDILLVIKPNLSQNYGATITDDNNGTNVVNDCLGNMFRGFSTEQRQQVMSTISSHMISVNPTEETPTGKHYSLSKRHG